MAKGLYEFAQEVAKIGKTANSIDVRGRASAAGVVFIIDKCEELLRDIDEAVREIGEKGEAADEPDREPAK